MWSEHGRLTLKAKHRSIDVWLPCKHADIVRQITGGEIVGAVHDDVVISHDLLRVAAGEAAFVQFEFDLRIDIPQPVARRCKLAAAHVLCSVKNLPLQIGEIDAVEIDDPKGSNAGCCQVSAAGEPRPPAPMHKTCAALSRFCPSAVTSGMMRCRE